ncbi:3,4-dihydroxy-2-butanone-4-phosphate synthase, partial [Francisella tularensis subsp. holarctica]|nr:3,4-dihydroxy-2-butanone-4-phosphate synthase [Francisella tularensis subsp. holarctica]
SCITGDIFGSLRCDCQDQLHKGIEVISEEGGFFIYLDQEGRGIGLTNKLKDYNLQMNENMDTLEANLALGLPADERKYDLAIQVLTYNNV